MWITENVVQGEMEEEVVDGKDNVVQEVEVPTTEQVETIQPDAPHEQPDIVQGVPSHSIDLPIVPSMETSPSSNNVKYLFCKVVIPIVVFLW